MSSNNPSDFSDVIGDLFETMGADLGPFSCMQLSYSLTQQTPQDMVETIL